MGAKESVEAAAKINADGWGHAEVRSLKKRNVFFFDWRAT